MSKITINTLNKMKAEGEKISVITSYDASFTQQIEKAGIDAKDIAGLIEGLDEEYPGIGERVLDGEGNAKRFIQIFRNDEEDILHRFWARIYALFPIQYFSRAGNRAAHGTGLR